MAKGTNQKLKLLYLMRIMLENTDENNGLTMKEIEMELSKYDIAAERKCLYNDLDALRKFGIDINNKKIGRSVYYCVASRNFEIAELKLLVDAVQSSKFITEKKSSQLIKKLEGYASIYEAKELHRQVYVHGRVKTMNESIYYNVDKIHKAIAENRTIQFQYYQWNVKKEMELRHKGQIYCISPWQLTWDNENYYMIGYDSSAKIMKHFRVDKMIKIELTDRRRDGKELFGKIDLSTYANKMFGMFDGDKREVIIQCENRFAGVMIDRFGKEVKMRPIDNEHFQISVNVAVSGNFIGWIIGIGPGIKIVEPSDVVERIKKNIDWLKTTYI